MLHSQETTMLGGGGGWAAEVPARANLRSEFLLNLTGRERGNGAKD